LSSIISQKVYVDLGIDVELFTSRISVFILWVALTSGRRSGYATFLELIKVQWETIHIYTSIAFTVILVIHLILNAKLFYSMLKCLTSPKVTSN